MLDKDTFRVGQTAPVMLTTPASNRYVLLTVEAKDLSSYQLIHVTGTQPSWSKCPFWRDMSRIFFWRP